MSSSSSSARNFSWPPKRLVIVGFGLLGGSLSMAARQAFEGIEIVAVGRNEKRLEEILSAKLADHISTDLNGSVKSGDWVILCQPVGIITQMLSDFCSSLPEDVLVTDVGSTKSRIVLSAESSKKGRAQFVGSHPMAGSEKTGWKNSRKNLFQNATTIVTPSKHTCKSLVSLVTDFWRSIGSRVIWMDPARHDELVGLVSHTPHLTASALVDLLIHSGDDASLLSLVAGNGLRDTTRVAMGSPDLWSQICFDNSDAISLQLEELAEKFQHVASLLREKREKEFNDLLERTSEFRCELNR